MQMHLRNKFDQDLKTLKEGEVNLRRTKSRKEKLSLKWLEHDPLMSFSKKACCKNQSLAGTLVREMSDSPAQTTFTPPRTRKVSSTSSSQEVCYICLLGFCLFAFVSLLLVFLWAFFECALSCIVVVLW